jgi:hypothetical protein
MWQIGSDPRRPRRVPRGGAQAVGDERQRFRGVPAMGLLRMSLHRSPDSIFRGAMFNLRQIEPW